MARLGVITGRFDPININDLAIAKQLARELDLGRISFVVIPGPDYVQRCAMVKAALRPYRKFDLANQVPKAGIELKDPGLDQGLISNDFCNLPFAVAQYALANGLYLDAITKRVLSRHRYEHVRSVAELTGALAAHYGLNRYHGITAGYLHDITKEYPKPQQRRMMEIYFPELLDRSPHIYHQYTAGIAVRQDFQVRQRDIIDAVSNHVNGTDRKLLSRILFCSDKIDDTRDFDNTAIKKICFADIDVAFEQIRNEQIAYLARSMEHE